MDRSRPQWSKRTRSSSSSKRSSNLCNRTAAARSSSNLASTDRGLRVEAGADEDRCALRSRRIRLGPATRSVTEMIRIAILDDYQVVALKMADWSPLTGRAELTVFNDHLSNFDDFVERLLPFDVVCVMRERTPLPRSVIERLPRLKLIASTGPRNAAIDVKAAAERGIVVVHTGYDARPTIEMTWALILASARQVALENAHLRAGGWQLTMGDSLHGKTLGVLGLGNIGAEVARIGLAFGIKVTASSQNLTADKG